jgi:hypothetical protein
MKASMIGNHLGIFGFQFWIRETNKPLLSDVKLTGHRTVATFAPAQVRPWAHGARIRIHRR